MNLVKNKTRRMTRFSRFLIRNAWTISIVGTLLGGVGAYYSVQLFKNLRTDFRELLPQTARSVLDLKEVSERLESIDSLAILIFSNDTVASKQFVIDLAQKLTKLPSALLSSVEYQIGNELKFFQRRQSLYLELVDLKKIETYVRERIEFERELYNPLTIFKEDEIPEPEIDFLALKQKYDGKASRFSRFPDGFYATSDQKKRVILAYVPGGGASGIDSAHKLKDAVALAIQELDPKRYAADLEVKYTGGVQDALEEHAALIADLLLSTVVVTILVTLAMLLFYRSFLGTFALVGSLFIGTFWTFGISYFLVGYLNANSAFLASIVIGNGINFGIMLLARYLEERRKLRSHGVSLHLALSRTMTSTLTAALAAALAYGSLVLTEFRGFNQFGLIGFVGMLLCWLSSYLLLPAYLTLLGRFFKVESSALAKPRWSLMVLICQLVKRLAPQLTFFFACISVLSLIMLTRFNRGILETDLSKLRNKDSIEKGSAFLSKNLDEIFGYYLSPMAVLPHSPENALKIAQILKEQKIQEGPSSLIASVQSLDDFLPKNQPEKIKILANIRALLPPELVLKLPESDRRKIKELLADENRKAFSKADLPQLVLDKFKEKNGQIGNLVLVEPPLTNITWDGNRLIEFVRSLRTAADSVEPGTAVAGTITITSDMIEAISKDGPKATLFAFIAVIFLIFALFRNIKTSLLCLFTLLLGVLWMAGIIMGFGVKINFLNFIALPITFGIGVDYGVNIFQRFRENPKQDILEVISQTGGAVALASFTTMTGYVSLLIAGNQGFVSFGLLAVLGELTCVTAAIITLPAFLLWNRERKAKMGS